jgi:hypothetical protein
MPRIRTIKPEFWLNEELAALPEHARLLAIALLNYADDTGCFLANPNLVRAACFPFEDHSKNVLGSLQELSQIGYVEIRDCDGKAIGRVCKFNDHQRIDKPQKSKLMPIFDAFPREIGNSKNVPRTFQERSKNSPRLEEEREREREREEEGEREDISSVVSEDRKPEPVYSDSPVFACDGDVKTWQPTQRQVEAWQQAYPQVDVAAELRKAAAWVTSNRRKTAKGMPRFVNGWLARTTDKSTGPPRTTTTYQTTADRTKNVFASIREMTNADDSGQGARIGVSDLQPRSDG